MKTIYLDSSFMCYTEPAEGRQAVETDAFDGICAGALECYRYIPAGQTWARPDGRITPGPFIQAVKESAEIQRQHELDEAVRWGGLDIPQEQDFTATRNYPAESFLAVQGQLYQVLHGIPNGGSIIKGQNVKSITTQEYINIITEG